MKFVLMFILSLFLSVSVYSKEITVSDDNTVRLNLVVDQVTVNKVIKSIQELDSNLKSGYPIYLALYTPGGEIEAGMQLIEFTKGLNRPVHTITIFAASMGFQFVQHMGTRYIINYGTLMSHKARGGFSGEFGGGYSQLDSRYGLWLRRIDMMDKVTVKKTNGKQTLKSYRDAYAPELWLNGPEAVAQGYADEVVNIKCDLSMRGSFIETFRIPQARMVVDVEFAKCPIITTPLSLSVRVYTNKGLMTLDDFIEKDGKFGKDCENSEKQDAYYYSNSDKTPKKEILCASDKTLTLKKVDELLEAQKKEFTKDLKKSVIYSY